MLSRIRQWLPNNRECRGAHARAWSGVIEPDGSGLSAFQQMAADSLCKAVPGISLARAGKNETYLTGSIPGSSASVFIYHCQAEVSDLLAGEYQDYSSPAELIQDFVAAAQRVAAA